MSGEPRPLDGIRVLELGHLVAGPFAATLLGYFGAEVIKLEPPAGDPLRGWRGLVDGTSLWWRSVGRNKKSVALDLGCARGRQLALDLARHADVLIENFRPGTLERWDFDLDALERENPGLVICRVSGYGQTGPYAERPGYASVCEAFGGLRHLTGEPGQPPVRSNLSLGDSLAALNAALGVVLALYRRDRSADSSPPAGRGDRVDVSIFESVFGVLESALGEYVHLDRVRGPSGSTITGVVPTGTYPCADGRLLVMGANSESLFQRLCAVIERPEWASDPDFAGNAARVERADEIDRAITAWSSSHSSAAAERSLHEARIPCSLINTIADLAGDPHVRARGLIEEVRAADGASYAVPGLSPRLGRGSGRSEWAGPALGEHTDEVLASMLGLDDAAIADLRAEGVVG